MSHNMHFLPELEGAERFFIQDLLKGCLSLPASGSGGIEAAHKLSFCNSAVLTLAADFYLLPLSA